MTKKEIIKLRKDTHFYIDMFGKNVHFCQDKESYKELLLSFGCEIDLENCQGLMWKDERDNRCFIGVFENDKSILVHESVHCALRIMEAVNQDLNYKDECLPYLTDLIYMKCIEKWKDK